MTATTRATTRTGGVSCVALLRGINVGGRSLVPMAQLRAILLDLAVNNPRTLLQSGNVVFEIRAQTSTTALEAKLEARAQQCFGRPIAFLLRTAAEWNAIIERNPFSAEAKRDPAHMLVMALKDAPTATAVKALRDGYTGPELIQVHGRDAYLVYPEGIGRSRLTNAVLERKLGTQGTARNWNTVRKLAALIAPPSAR